MGRLSESQARLLIGSILLLILSINAAQVCRQCALTTKPAMRKGEAYAKEKLRQSVC